MDKKTAKSNRRYGDLNKVLLYILGILLTGISAMQLYYSANLTKLAVITERVNTVIVNQGVASEDRHDLRTIVKGIGDRVARGEYRDKLTCERENIYWPQHKIDCVVGK